MAYAVANRRIVYIALRTTVYRDIFADSNVCGGTLNSGNSPKKNDTKTSQYTVASTVANDVAFISVLLML